ncbi:MAG TPA: biotin carboxylase N-terminal domain-containing protein [Candidatus Acidoferrum sp.]|nr:biotin carboxylase N-terminal domain-containing protein [Candidatus Acidoferrum sp.]
MNINRLFIANRGEIALRIIRTCRQLGIETVLGVSAADQDSMPAKLADRTVLLGPAKAADSYLNVQRVVAAAQQARADALHPGYGFLSENSALAEACAAHGIVFVGPTPAQLLAVGDKLRARQAAQQAGLPLINGAAVATAVDAQKLAAELGLLVLIKAVGGGGGRGMKVVRALAEMQTQFDLASAEAKAAFGNPHLYIERYVERGRHIEVQVFGDGSDVIHFGTRDCSIQRRYQKLVEEAPAPNLSPSLRSAIETAAVTFAKHLSYRGAGTVEFLLDCERNDFYFLEMNARIQVEHPVTEQIAGVDLVAQQIRIAEGRPLGLCQQDVKFNGHSIECRLNAEDPARDFQPSPGRVTLAQWAAGTAVRVDSHIETGSMVPPYYDSLLGKLIVTGTDRADALNKLQRALAACRFEGISTNLELLQRIAGDSQFAAGGVTTGFLPVLLGRKT